MRKQIVAGNWKMNTTPEEGVTLVKALLNQSELSADTLKIVIPPAVHLDSIGRILKGTSIHLGAQNSSEHEAGAYTGEVSSSMLASIGVQYVLVGHSERREYHHETEAILSKKIDRILDKGLTPIYCFGEVLEDRKNGTFMNVISNQVVEGLKHLTSDQMQQIILAYEPVWAIGTGETASPEQAQEVHEGVRKILTNTFDEATGQNTSILYGGSVKPANAKELFSKEDIDGGLIGGAALNADDFAAIINAFE
jgi:triosephosphate isomerase